MKIVFASNNAGKICELQALLNAFNLKIIPQTELGVSEVPETEFTFVENALIKARHACRATGLPAMSDDSGLVVPALQGAPGIYSARYAGNNATSHDNINKLLKELDVAPDNNRKAYFHCVLVYLAHAEDPTPLICHGMWQGVILKNPQGDNGFGYDPIFFDTEHNLSAAELPLEIKNRISHRGKALRLLMTLLPEKISGD
jgi:XTP/dITP diphosphohydrolase